MVIEETYSLCLEYVFHCGYLLARTTAVLAEVFGEKFETRGVTAFDDDASLASLNAEIVRRSEEKLAWDLDVLRLRNVVEFVAVKGGE